MVRDTSAWYQRAAVIASVAAVVNSVIQLTNPTFDSEFTSAVDWANELSFTLLVAASMVAMWGLVVTEFAPRRGGITFVTGQAILLAGLLPGFVLGHAPEWFAAAGLPGNLVALVGAVIVAVYAWRHATLGRVTAVLLPLSVLVGVGIAEHGGGLVAATVWGTVALRLAAPVSEPVGTGV